MENMSDQEIQNLLDGHFKKAPKDLDFKESEDIAIYKSIYKALEVDNVSVPHSFAKQVSIELFYREERKKKIYMRLYVGALIGILSIVGLAVFNAFGFAILASIKPLLNYSTILFAGSIILLVFVANTVESLLSKQGLKSRI